MSVRLDTHIVFDEKTNGPGYWNMKRKEIIKPAGPINYVLVIVFI